MKIIAIKDSKNRGYTVYHEEFPEVVAQVEDLKDANQTLSDIFEVIMTSAKVEKRTS